MPWIPKQPPHYLVKKWYCWTCNKVTKIEDNPNWVKDGKPDTFDAVYAWMCRCKKCHRKHCQGSADDCPKCGTPPVSYEDHYFVKDQKYPVVTDYHGPSQYASFEWGIEGYDWDETHYCFHCKKEFKISTSNY